jgi:hypothetical protein
MTHSITTLPTAFLTVIEILSLCTSIPIYLVLVIRGSSSGAVERALKTYSTRGAPFYIVSRRSPQGNRQMRRILNQAANAAVEYKGSIFQILYRRYVPRMGHNQTIGIIAHKLCRLVWKILHRGIRYEERGPEVSKASKQKRTRKMIQALRRLGYQIEPSLSQSAITA